MVIKVRLIKPKLRQIHSFYRTSEIKFQSLSTPSFINFRSRSTQKLIKLRSPWQQITHEEIDALAERLQDKPQQLYQAVKQNQRQKNQLQIKTKFNRLPNYQNPLSKSIRKIHSIEQNDFIKTKNLPNFTRDFSKENLFRQDHSHNRILNRIKEKKKQYERQMKNMIQEKRIVLQTDLPRINRIKVVHQPKLRLKLTQTNNALPVWKMR